MFIWLLATYGMAFSFCYRFPFDKEKLPTYFEKLLNCMFCTGFWCGMISALFCFSETFTLSFPSLILILAHGFAGAGSTYFIDAILQRIEIEDA
jgi:hypothetical protein